MWGERRCISSILQEDSKAGEDAGENDGKTVALAQVGDGGSSTWLVGGVGCGGTSPAGGGRRESSLRRVTAGSSRADESEDGAVWWLGSLGSTGVVLSE